MAITDIDISETLEAGAPSIKYSGNRDPNQMMMASAPNPMAEKNDMALEMFGKELRLLSEEEMDILDEEIQRLRSKFMASGGRVQYGLGSLVKSIAKGAKKIIKSDLGKAALLGAAAFGVPGTQFGGLFGRAGLGGAATGLFGQQGIGATLGQFGANKALMEAGSSDYFGGPTSMWGGIKKALGSKLGKTALGAAGLASIYKAAGADVENPNELPRSTDELKELLKRGYKNLNPKASDVEVEEFVRVNSAQGGRIGYAFGTPDTAQAAAVMGNLPVRQNQAGVSEVDLRDTGGFIPPVGVKEKADDVPAMLSNNEFVFTADAVRAAGGGSVNKGAQRMYDLMKNLESKVV